MKKKLAISCAILIASIAGENARAANSRPNRKPAQAISAEPVNESSKADDELLKKMPLRKKIGQMFMIGFKGTSMEDELGDSIKAINPGALIIFSRNLASARQITSMNAAAQKLSIYTTGLPLLISTDQEGGDVIRVRTAVPLPSQLALGSTEDPSIAETAGFATGQLLHILGFNMNLAPVLDVSDPKQMSFIGTRTYGSDPKLVAQMAIGFSEGLYKANILPTAKHFPGHGGGIEDSHSMTPQKFLTYEELKEADLVPFASMQSHFPNRWATMLGNIAYPALDASRDPATISAPIVGGILRKEMHFNGLVITDDIQMGADGKLKDSREHVLRAIEAGADMIMVVWNKGLQLDFVDTVEKAVRSGRISVKRIDASLKRIMKVKHEFAAVVPNPTDADLKLALQNPKFGEVSNAILANRFNRPLDEDEKSFQTFAAGKPVLLFAANQRFSLSFKEALENKTEFRAYGLDVERPNEINRIMLAHPDAVGVFYLSGYQAAKVASAISDDVARRMLVVTVETPGTLKNVGSFRLIKSVYFRHPNTGKLTAERYFDPTTDIRVPASSVSVNPTDE